MDPTVVTWVLVIWGVITLAPLTAVQMALLLSPHSARSKEWVIGNDEDWLDKDAFPVRSGRRLGGLAGYCPALRCAKDDRSAEVPGAEMVHRTT